MSEIRKPPQKVFDVERRGALPDDRNGPAGCLKSGKASTVARHVPLKFSVPELYIRRRPAAAWAVVPMPKATVDEHGNAIAGQHDVGRTVKIPTVKPISVSGTKQRRPRRQFGARVLASHRGHHPGPIGRWHSVHHGPPVSVVIRGRQ